MKTIKFILLLSFATFVLFIFALFNAIQLGNCDEFDSASSFYTDVISTELVASGHVMDVFAGALDQVGLAEMKAAVMKTGGIAILTETFAHDIFKKVHK